VAQINLALTSGTGLVASQPHIGPFYLHILMELIHWKLHISFPWSEKRDSKKVERRHRGTVTIQLPVSSRFWESVFLLIRTKQSTFSLVQTSWLATTFGLLTSLEDYIKRKIPTLHQQFSVYLHLKNHHLMILWLWILFFPSLKEADVLAWAKGRMSNITD
jgi:hypothetical protein